MGIHYRSTGAFLSFMSLLFVSTIPSQYCCATDTLTQAQQIFVGQTLISFRQIFELGFFSPRNSGKLYVGMWYKNISVHRVVWVANRENPLKAVDSASSLTIGKDGNLNLLDGTRHTVWSTNVSFQSNSSFAVLSDNGDFILKDNVSGVIMWESFNYPCDTFLPGMMIGTNTKTGEKRYLSSWKTEEDPSPGKFVGALTTDTPPQAFIWNGSNSHWRGGPWDGWKFIGIPDTKQGYANGFNLLPDNQKGSAYLTFNTYNISYVTFVVLTPLGSLKIMNWDEEIKNWYVKWVAPENPCDFYGVCGPFGVCNKKKAPICDCLKGFVPKSTEDWSKGNWTGGCVRRTELLCQKNITSLALGKAKNDGFWKLNAMKLPDHFEYLYNEDSSSCQKWCLRNCSCVAYAHVAGIGCMVWAGGLMDVQQFSFAGDDLFVRLAHSELGKDTKKAKLIVSFTTISAVFVLATFVCGLYWRRANKRGKRPNRLRDFVLGDIMDNSRDTLQETASRDQVIHGESSELPTFCFNKIVVATDNFSITNKLGEGGFGPVYKGKLEDGTEVAVKRLSSHSGQGSEEFRNEVILISKLQHRNLVRLLGCCIEGEEMLLIYEYMTNRSLDTFLFDAKKRVQLDWAKRFHIILGIARGLLYLHRDSCLRVIHRDLKASNILLDDHMNPKISDFGLARTFRLTQELAKTHRVVGTFGYMSPEYAMGGLFSEKSDVFSFGVLLLEIVSGMRNTILHYHEKYANLLGYAWQLWNEKKALDLMDEALAESPSQSDVMRCIHIGLLCIQDHVVDRPTMSAVVVMLSSGADLPLPKQPTSTMQTVLDSDLRSQHNDVYSVNEASVSVIVGR
ncbi:G-type lectin S-receptor-like serine/threonine-protein kinase [Actinidia chinensis var. chinensis]|uniref:Receptor-like serine/threonine-protein kinase n=1 Tax=Actinidia chinensis var. chinensis TaxID=1590841 RepID=A0A2R6RB02_ACTCC|nr:G-type lectin S-receptor-like serine/threonine-protein kinase [Actinidia chinensis var. chinensis]